MTRCSGAKPRLATVWLSGCSGCHMSFLDLDEWLMELANQVEIVYSPIASDQKTFPEAVDITLVEGAVATTDNLDLLNIVRARSRTLISFGDCAISGNVTALRNASGGPQAVLQRAYLELAENTAQLPHAPGLIPDLLETVRPVHELVPVEVYLPGCPPSAQRIRLVLEALLQGKSPRLEGRDQIRLG